MNRTQGRPPVRLIQLQSAQSAPKQAPDFAPGTVACSTFTTTPPPTIPTTKRAKGFEPSTFSWESAPSLNEMRFLHS